MDKPVEEFQHYIYGIDFPADKEEVAATAEDSGAPDNLVQMLESNQRPPPCKGLWVRFGVLASVTNILQNREICTSVTSRNNRQFRRVGVQIGVQTPGFVAAVLGVEHAAGGKGRVGVAR